MDDEAANRDREDFEITVAPIEPDPSSPAKPASTTANPFTPRRTRRAHLLRTSAVWAVVVVVTAALLIASLRPFLAPSTQRRFVFATPTTVIEPGRVYFMGWAPWGQLRVDSAPALTLTSQLVYPATDGFLWPSFVLAPGRHTLTYTAEDFPTLTCVLSVPEAQSDTCPITHLPNGVATDAQHSRRALILPASPERLATATAADLDAATQQALDAFALHDTPRAYGVVAAGEPIQLATNQVVRASAPLRAYPHYTLNTDPTTATTAIALAPTSACVTLCASDPQLSLYPDESSWPVTANVAISWEYRNADGSPANLTPAPSAVAHVRVDLAALRTESGWQVQVLQQPLCQTALQQAQALSPSPQKPATPISWTALSYDPVVDGCLLAGYLPTPSGATTAPTVLLVYRFGVLLTANPLASQLYPQQPAASADQAARAQAIIGA